MSSKVTEGYNLNLTNTTDLPDLAYINELAREKNFEFGGGFTKHPPILSDLFYLFEKEREDGSDFDKSNYLFSKDTIAKEVLERELTESEIAYYGYTLKFLEGLNYESCPGYSPMDKALNTIMYMVYLSEKQNNSNGPQHDPQKKSDKTVSPEQMEELLKEMSNGVPEDSDGGGKKKEKELSKDVISCVRDHLYDLNPTIANIYAKEKVADIPINPHILRDIKIKSYLEEKLGMEVNLERSLKENNSSSRKRIKNLDSYSQVMKASKTQMVLPNFDDKLAKKELTIKQKVLPETRKQIITFMLDDSGSMGSIQKQSYVRATLLKYLEGVMEGKAKMNFYSYESQRYGFREIKDLKDAQELFRDISLRSPCGGGTNIGQILQETIDDIATDQNYHDPEVVICLDGDDFVDPKTLKLKNVRINAIVLGCDNPGLKEICESSGGFYSIEKMYSRH